MKALFSREYYEKHWDELINPVMSQYYINLEADFERDMECYKQPGIDQKLIEMIELRVASNLADKCYNMCMEHARKITALLNGSASMGYVTKIQEEKAVFEFRKRFDFNCLQLAIFKEKHGIA